MHIEQHWLDVFPGATVIKYVDNAACYEGWGCALAQFTDGTWRTADYSHCSCNGIDDSMSINACEDTEELALRHLSDDQRADLLKGHTYIRELL